MNISDSRKWTSNSSRLILIRIWKDHGTLIKGWLGTGYWSVWSGWEMKSISRPRYAAITKKWWKKWSAIIVKERSNSMIRKYGEIVDIGTRSVKRSLLSTSLSLIMCIISFRLRKWLLEGLSSCV